MGFGLLAVLCALAASAIVSRERAEIAAGFGPSSQVVTTARPLARGAELSTRSVERLLELREVPAAFLPPDALGDPLLAVGRAPLAPVPEGSYLLASHLGHPERPRDDRELGKGLRAVEVGIAGGEAIAAVAPNQVDVVVAEETLAGANRRVRVLADAVRLLDLRAGTEQAADGEPLEWVATLGVDRRQALELIEADNFAREVRLIPR